MFRTRSPSDGSPFRRTDGQDQLVQEDMKIRSNFVDMHAAASDDGHTSSGEDKEGDDSMILDSAYNQSVERQNRGVMGNTEGAVSSVARKPRDPSGRVASSTGYPTPTDSPKLEIIPKVQHHRDLGEYRYLMPNIKTNTADRIAHRHVPDPKGSFLANQQRMGATPSKESEDPWHHNVRDTGGRFTSNNNKADDPMTNPPTKRRKTGFVDKVPRKGKKKLYSGSLELARAEDPNDPFLGSLELARKRAAEFRNPQLKREQRQPRRNSHQSAVRNEPSADPTESKGNQQSLSTKMLPNENPIRQEPRTSEGIHFWRVSFDAHTSSTNAVKSTTIPDNNEHPHTNDSAKTDDTRARRPTNKPKWFHATQNFNDPRQPSPTKKKREATESTALHTNDHRKRDPNNKPGAKSDPRMIAAVKHKKDNPNVSTKEALIQGGYRYKDDAVNEDEDKVDGIKLKHRIRNLNKNLAKLKKSEEASKQEQQTGDFITTKAIGRFTSNKQPDSDATTESNGGRYLTVETLPLGCPYMRCPAPKCTKIQMVPPTSGELYQELLANCSKDDHGLFVLDMNKQCNHIAIPAMLLRYHALHNCQTFQEQLGRIPELSDLPTALQPRHGISRRFSE